MRLPAERQSEVRVEIVTSAFVASGTPEGVHDLGRFLENLNNPAVASQIELREPSVRHLYQAALHVELDAPLLIRRADVIFATFEGPHFARGVVKPPTALTPVLLMAPPFQISGSLEVAPSADPTQAMRTALPPFFAVRSASVYDTDGIILGEGEQIIVNGAAVQMQAASRRRIESVAPVVTTAPVAQRRLPLDDIPDEKPRRVTQAA